MEEWLGCRVGLDVLPACRPRRLAFGSLQSLVIYCSRPIP